MTLRELLSQAGVDPVAVDGDAPLSGICSDSRKASPGCLFVCMPSPNSDSHSFLDAARDAGAVAALVHSAEGFGAARALGMAAAQLPHPDLTPTPNTQHQTPSETPNTQHPIPTWAFNEALCKICNVFFDYPTRHMKVVGVTGTNGKTTVAWLIRDMLRALGLRAAYLGTLGFQLPRLEFRSDSSDSSNGSNLARDGDYDIEECELANTTPFPVELYTMLAEARDRGVEALAMEVSSHALAERRCEYVEFDVGVFTNLTQDHMDFHGTMEAYEAAKLRLFTELPEQTEKPFRAVLNVDDAMGQQLASRLFVQRTGAYLGGEHAIVRYGLPGQEVSADVTAIEVDRIVMVLRTCLLAKQRQTATIEIRLGGTYNVENCLAAAAAIVSLGYSLDSLEEVLPRVRPVPGRFEAVPNDASIGILVDYAHTPDALEKLLDAVRPLTKGRVITVFGCGGDRDRNKRPKMAKAASERSDVVVVTSDNPRTEDPQAIIEDVAAGIEGEVDWQGAGSPPPNPPPQRRTTLRRGAIAIIDRGEAIAHAIEIARPGDVVVIAGKGHENYQIIGRTKYPMDDRELAREGLRRRALGVGR